MLKENKLFKLITLPISLVLKLVRLPFTIMGCIAKLGCLIVVAGVVAGIVAVLVYTYQVPGFPWIIGMAGGGVTAGVLPR